VQWQTEVKFKGQARAGKMLLDAKLKADDMRRFLPRVLPLAFGFALAVTNPLVGSCRQVIQAGLGDTALFSVTSSCHTASLVLNG